MAVAITVGSRQLIDAKRRGTSRSSVTATTRAAFVPWYPWRPVGGRQPPLGRWFFSDRPALLVRVREETWSSIVTTGTIKRVVSERGFGFIIDPDGKEYFFHRSGLSPSIDFDRLVGGESVSFQIEAGPKGPRAIEVQTA
jgi:CspA family cold shock protein